MYTTSSLNLCASDEAVVATMDLWYMGKSCGTPGANNSVGSVASRHTPVEARKRFDKADAVYSQIRDKYLSLRKSTRTEIASAIEESITGSLLILLLELRKINAANTVRVNNVLLVLC
ncbi:hypothetical protein Tco_1222777 [Tanacetum coccineum]